MSHAALNLTVRHRLKWFTAFVLLAFFGILLRLFHLQILQGADWKHRSHAKHTRFEQVPAPRGDIVDRNGRLLATDKAAYQVLAIPYLVQRDAQLLSRLQALFPATPIPVSSVKRLFDSRGYERFRGVVIWADVNHRVVARLEARRNQLPGIYIRATPQRSYPPGRLASHLVGWIGEINAQELNEWSHKGYRARDYLGRWGLERHYEWALRGRDGTVAIAVDAAGVPATVNGADGEFIAERREPVAGNRVETTIDLELMKIVAKEFETAATGAVVVIDVEQGDVLAWYSKPNIDPNRYIAGVTTSELQRDTSDPLKPFIDRVVNAYIPGSVYKPISALAALGEAKVDLTEKIQCDGRHLLHGTWFNCHARSGHGKVDLQQAIAQSCDVFFYQISERIGLDALAVYAAKFGLGSGTDTGVNFEKTGITPTQDWYRKNVGAFYWGDTFNASVGQGANLASPLQIAMMYAAIANGGTLYKPRIVTSIKTDAGAIAHQFESSAVHRIRAESIHWNAIRQGMVDAVNHSAGTAFNARSESLEFAGKTGTAQVVSHASGVREHRDHAWFAGFAPAQTPRWSIVVFVEHGGSGGKVAAPIARNILEKYARIQLAMVSESNGEL